MKDTIFYVCPNCYHSESVDASLKPICIECGSDMKRHTQKNTTTKANIMQIGPQES